MKRYTLLFVLMVCLMPGLALAQETLTPGVTEPIEQETDQQQETRLIERSAALVQTLTNAQLVQTLLTIAASFVGVFAAGGTLVVMMGRINKQQKDLLEQLFQATPPEVQKQISEFMQGLLAVVKVMADVTDGKPNVDPPGTGDPPDFSDRG